MQGVHLLGIALMVFILLWIVSIYRTKKEGFEESDDSAHDTFNLKAQEKYNNVGTALHASKNIGILGTNSQSLLGGVIDIMGSDNKIEQQIDNQFPLAEGKTGMLAKIDKCQKVKVTDCNAFDNAEFSSTCGLCLTVGTDAENKPATGGLVLTKSDREFALSTRKGNFLPSYEPTIGTCPAGMFVSNKKECIRVQKQLECAQGSTFDSSTGCSQCYGDSSYSIVDRNSDPDNPNPDLIVGYGTVKVYGEGSLKYKQANTDYYITKNLSLKTPIIITLAGDEFDNILTLNVLGERPAVPYDDDVVYTPGDNVIFKDKVYKMIEGAGDRGYNPDRVGDKLWKKPPISIENYVEPGPAYIMGYLQGPTSSGVFNNDLYQLIASDSLTGRKPRTTGSIKKDGLDLIKMGPGFGQMNMTLTMKPVFTFVDPLSQEATLCPSSPFITKAASSTFLGSDPCYAKGSKPGNYSLECIQNMFISNGCLNAGKGFPETSKSASTILYDSNASARNLNDIATYIYNMAILSSTGNDEAGIKASITDWSNASEFCTGKTISSPCDTGSKDTGPLSDDCLAYLWDNRGENTPEGATYSATPNARSLFSTGRTNRFCTRAGTRSPLNAKGSPNPTALAFWKKRGGAAAVKALMKNIHQTANNVSLSETAKKDSILQCYGIVSDNSSSNFVSNWLSSSDVDNSVPANPAGKDMGCWNDNSDRMFKGSNQGRSFTPEACSQKARQLGHKYSAVQDGNECYTGNDSDNWKRYGEADAECSPTGGPWIARVYDASVVPPDQSPPPTDYSNSVTYKLGDRVKFKSDIYLMVEAAGSAGYAPDRVGDKLWKLSGVVPGGSVWDISTPRVAGVVDIPVGNYTLSFDITAKSNSPGDWGNIIHVSRTGTNCCDVGSRSPAIWFFPNSTALHVRIGDTGGGSGYTGNGNWGVDTDPLPIGQKVRFTLIANGSAITIKLEGGSMNKIYNATQPNSRPTGTGFKIYMNDTALAGGFIPAPARIENLNYIVDGKKIEVLQTGNWPTPPPPPPAPPQPPPRIGAGWNF